MARSALSWRAMQVVQRWRRTRGRSTLSATKGDGIAGDSSDREDAGYAGGRDAFIDV